PRWAQRIGTAVAAAALLGTLGLSLFGSASRPEAPARDQHAVVRLEVVRVSAGTVLELPARDASATQSGREVVTQPNDSVARLADGLGTTRGAVREAILRANPGMTLPKSDHTLLPAGTRFTAPAGTGDTWATQVDDNLTWIAHRFGLRAWIDIADANRDRLAGRDVDLIHPGENWDVPGAASPSPEPTVPTTPPTTGPTTPPTGPITPPATPATPPSPLSSEPTTAPTPTPSQTPTTGPETSTSTPGASPTPGGTGSPGPTGSPSELSDVRGSPSPVGRVVLLVVGGAAAVLAAGFGVWALLRRMRSWSAVDVVGSLTGARDGIRRGAAAFWGTPMGPGRARAAVRVGGGFGFAGGVALAVVGAGTAATVAGVVVAGAAVLALLRSKWTPQQIRAPTRAELGAAFGRVRAAVAAWGSALAAWGRSVRDGWPIEWTVTYWKVAVQLAAQQLWDRTRRVAGVVFSPAGLVHIAVGAVFVAATGAQLVWALPTISAMVAFQVRGTLNTFKDLLSKNVWVQRGLLAAIAATLSVNLPLHLRGVLNHAAPDAFQVIAGLFGVTAVTTVIGTLAMLAALFTPSSPDKGPLAKRWDRMADRLATIGATTTLVSIPFLIYAVLAHPSFDGIVNIHPVVLGLVLATFTGFGGEALLHLAGKVTKWSPPARLVKFFSVYSAATIAAYGMIYQLRHLPLLISVTGALTLGGLAHWVLTRPHLSPRAKVGHTLAGAALTGVNALAAAALFLGWPALPTAVAITTGVVGVLATLAWAWSIRGPPSGPSGPTTPDTGTPRPTGPSSTSPTTGGAAPPTEKPGGK
ncbi:MAG TPA: hypothetical protein VKZ81_02120, partial [Pseudonocardia sp.]|nr:hypothetical protein [Pseudonocardia sp.]